MNQAIDEPGSDAPVKIDLKEVLANRNNPAAANPPVDPAAPEPPAAPPAPEPEPPQDPFMSRFGRPADEIESQLTKTKWVEEDPFIQRVLDQYRQGQSLDKIVTVLGKNWKDAPDEDIIRELYAREGIADKELQEFKLRQDYGDYTPEDDTPEAKLARMSLAKKAAEARSLLLKEQSEFGQPVNHQEKDLQTIQKLVDEWHSQVDSNPMTKALNETKRLPLTIEGQVQNLEVDSNQITKLVKGYGDFLSAIGDLSLERQYQVAAFVSNPEQFMTQLVELGKTTAKEALLREERNPAPVSPPAPPGLPDLGSKNPKDWTAEEKAAFVRGAVKK